MRSTPSEVLMGIHDNVCHVAIVKHIVPKAGVKPEGVVEDKLQARLLLFHQSAYVDVELLKNVNIGIPPGLIDWLDSGQSGMGAPSSK